MSASKTRHQYENRHPCIAGCGALVGKANRRCLKCYVAMRRAQSPSPLRDLSISASSTVLYPCINVCGKHLREPGQRCFQCQRAHLRQSAAIANHKVVVSKAMKSISTGASHGVMVIGDEVWSMPALCVTDGCLRPMLFRAKCYSCATGRPITISITPQVMRRADVLRQAKEERM